MSSYIPKFVDHTSSCPPPPGMTVVIGYSNDVSPIMYFICPVVAIVTYCGNDDGFDQPSEYEPRPIIIDPYFENEAQRLVDPEELKAMHHVAYRVINDSSPESVNLAKGRIASELKKELQCGL